ncbi:MAG: tetratricopeptide repeat protein, partial [Candidatus Cloacimonetes bacterium]|nr:tetratricopeptide repeat protein [Candidatus Cloacimonadota bacterium]
MKNLVPVLILENLQKKKFHGTLSAVTMFIDISGFTAMTQSLMKNGKEGAEILTDIINTIFTPSIDNIYENNGFISTFAGDAFSSIFPLDKSSADNAIFSAIKIQKIFKKIAIQNTKFGAFNLKVKIGLSIGEVEWRIINTDKKNDYFFRGEAIDNSVHCETRCETGEIVIDELLKNVISSSTSKIEKGYFLIGSKNTETLKPLKKKTIRKYDLHSFIPKSILTLSSRGEFRDVISCFISFEEKEGFHKGLAEIISLAEDYGGYFNKIDFSDKGGVALVLFGAPITKEQMEIRACSFTLSVMEIDNFNCRIGLSYGVAFAGFVGSKKREEYTSLGMSVNLASRFMMKARWKEIFIDRFIFEKVKENFDVSFIDNFKFKGFFQKIPTYKLNKEIKQVKRAVFEGKLFGRETELKKIKSLINKINTNKFGGIIYNEGEAGIGKSRLIYEIRQSFPSNEYHLIYMPCDAILRKSFNPVKSFLSNFFIQSEQNTSETNWLNFEEKIRMLPIFTQDKQIHKELNRTKSFLGALINLHWKNSLYSNLDPESRYLNTLYALTNLVKHLSLEKPVIIEFEDTNWIDNDTLNFLEVLTRNIGNFPVVIIASCRFNDDESSFSFNLQDVKKSRITLRPLDKISAKLLLEERLNKDTLIFQEIPDITLNIVWEKSQGNPFFIEQIILFLKEKNILADDLSIIGKDFEIPANINSIIVARIDKLNPELKDFTKTASVLGNNFTKKILSSMLKNAEIDKYIKDGEKENIWFSENKNNHVFKNVFIRESIYELILKKDLRHFHKLAAKSIENIYKSGIENYYTDLAYNYDKAEIFKNAIYYLEKAGDHEKNLYHNLAAIEYYERLISILNSQKNENDKLKFKIILNKIELLLLIGDTEPAKIELEKLNPGSIKDLEQRDRYFYLSAHRFVVMGNFIELRKYIRQIITKLGTDYYKYYIEIYLLEALRYLNEAEEFKSRAYRLLDILKSKNELFFEGRLSNTIGIFYLNKANYDKAKIYFLRNYEIVQQDNNKTLIQAALHNIGIVHSRLGDRKKAMEFYQKALKIAEEIGSKYSASKLLSDIAIVYASEGDVQKAIECYEKGLELAGTVGNKTQEGLILYNLGDAYYRLEKFSQALDFLHRSKNMCEKIKDLVGITFANDVIGDIFFRTNKLKKAKGIYINNLKLQTKLNDIEGIAHTFGNLGNCAKAAKQFNEAEKYFAEQQKTLAEVGDKEGEGKAFFNWAMLEVERKNPERAIIKLEKALVLFEACSFQTGINLAKE